MLFTLNPSVLALVATFSKPAKDSEVLKVVVSAEKSSTGWKVRTERFTKKQAFTEPTVLVDAEPIVFLDGWISEPFGQILVQTPEGDLQVLRVFRGDNVKSTVKNLAPSRKQWGALVSDRVKQKSLTVENDAEFLIALDLAGPDGRIKSAMADKFRQVNHLLSQIIPAVANNSGTLSVVDAGCGKAYLSLSLMYVLQRDGVHVRLYGIDASQHVVDHCTTVAGKLGLENARFTCATIGSVDTGEECDLLIALHACDTATDEAIALGLTMNASLMLVAPCCHHEVQKQLRLDAVPEYARPLLDDGITKERLGDLLTDTMRRDIMRALGYDAHLEEFISLEHTQKNILLRAERQSISKPEALKWAHRVREMQRVWGVAPRLLQIVSLPEH